MRNIEPIIESFRERCCRYESGECSIVGCLRRGGYVSGPPDYSIATCPAHETVVTLTRVAEECDTATTKIGRIRILLDGMINGKRYEGEELIAEIRRALA